MRKRLMIFCVFAVTAGLVMWTCSKSNPASSGGAPAITTQPASQTVNEGSPATFTVVATGDPAPTYQWQKNGVDISGATSATYTIATTTVANSGTYRVVVTNSAGSVTSNNATLTVTSISPTAPTIATQPQSLTVDSDSSATFTVVATGNPAPSYQWRKNGINIPGATSATYTINSVTPADAGTYTVRVSNNQGSVTSNDAVLTVNSAPQTWNYTISGNTINIFHPAATYTYSYCNGTTLSSYSSTDTAYTETDTFSLSGNTLTVYGVGDSGNPAVFTRIGSGSGIQGQWQGQMSGGFVTVTLVISSSTMTVTMTFCYADEWINYDWPNDSAGTGFNGTATQLSCTQVRIHGNTTGEQVTITFTQSAADPNGYSCDKTFTSTNSAHTTQVYYANPTSCPNDYPYWYYTFLSSSAPASAAKKAVGPSVPPTKRHLKKTVFG